jgi:dolichol-phosphate mannosyltransferase
MIAAVIPAYKTKAQIQNVLREIGEEIHKIYVIDDGCPEETGRFVNENLSDKRIELIFLEHNQGVGAAVLAGYKRAIEEKFEIIVKLDSDGQMDPRLIKNFIDPILNKEADYTKGSRFSSYQHFKGMPIIRLFGNMMLSIITKFSSGYWNIFDPTNGFTAIHRDIAKDIVEEKVAKGYFFESDMLYWLYIMRAKVVDIPIKAIYRNEKSSLNVTKEIIPFVYFNTRNFFKRIGYAYFMREFSLYSLALIAGFIFMIFGISYGAYHWNLSTSTGSFASAGTVMISALPIILGLQLLIYFFTFDFNNYPQTIMHDKR